MKILKDSLKKYLAVAIVLFLALPVMRDVLTLFTKITDHAVLFRFISYLDLFSVAAGKTILIIVSTRYNIKKSFLVAVPCLIYDALIIIYSIIINQEPLAAAIFVPKILLLVINPLIIILVAKLLTKFFRDEKLLILTVILALFFISMVYSYFNIIVTNNSYGTHFPFSLIPFKLPLIQSVDMLTAYFLFTLIVKRNQVKKWILRVFAHCK